MLDAERHALLPYGVLRRDAHRGRPDPGQHLAPARGLPLLRGEQPRHASWSATRCTTRLSGRRSKVTTRSRCEVIVTNGGPKDRSFWRDCWKAGRMSSTPSRRTGTIRRSGSTARGALGKPKGAVHLHHDIIYTCETYARHVLEVSEDDMCFSASKLFHAYGSGNNISFPYWAGASTVLFPGKPDAEADPWQTQSVQTDPVLLGARRSTTPCSTTREPGTTISPRSGCASRRRRRCPQASGGAGRRRSALVILDGIGSTEMLHIFISNTPEEFKPGSSGKPVPGYEAKILDEEGYPVEPGEAGYLSVKGDSAAAYYWRNHEKTKATMQGEWLFAGDWYRVDEDGFYWYEGRADDMIKVSGLWVSPVEVESTLGDHPAVIEAAAVGVPVDESDAGEGLHRPSQGRYEASEELVENCRTGARSVSSATSTRTWSSSSKICPKTVTGKIQRFKLREPETGVQMPRQEDELV